MPDIDIDFCYERRGQVIEYVRTKYGRDAVGQIVTFGTMKSRAVIRDVGVSSACDVGSTDKIAKMIPNQPGQSYTVQQAVERIHEVKALYNSDERHRRLFDYSMTLEGLSRHASVHAAGVVIAPGPLDDYVPICTQSKGKGAGRGAGKRAAATDSPDIVTQYDMNSLEDAGMLKMDFLGLKTLTVIHDAVRSVKARLGEFRHRRRAMSTAPTRWTRCRSTTQASTRCWPEAATPASSSSSPTWRWTSCGPCAATASTTWWPRTR